MTNAECQMERGVNRDTKSKEDIRSNEKKITVRKLPSFIDESRGRGQAV
jgi:hypothetical protein